jgi:predicted PP-loop superfamily ATPase
VTGANPSMQPLIQLEKSNGTTSLASSSSTAVAMSGGVDSSTVAAMLRDRGDSVIGLTMQLWNQRRLPQLQGDGPAQHR